MAEPTDQTDPTDPTGPGLVGGVLAALPSSFVDTRNSLHRLAMHVVYRPLRAAAGRYGLRWTPGGFGTPVFGAAERVRVQGCELVHERNGEVRSTPIATLRSAAEFVGIGFDPDFDHGMNDVVAAGDPDEDLHVDEAAALALGAWYGLATSVLDEVRARAPDASPTAAQLWPEHFDLAIDLAYGAGDSERVNVGFSPGDPGPAGSVTSMPYVYVGPWTSERPGDPSFWNQPFGAILGHDDIRDAGDPEAQRARVLAFVDDGLGRLR